MKNKKVVYGSLAILSIGACFLLSNHSINQPTSNVLEVPPSAMKEIHADLDVLPFDESVSKSDLIVRVKINKRVDSVTVGPITKTIFDANIKDVIKDKNNISPKNIKIMQQGSEELSFNGNALFEENEDVILFLMASKTMDNTYWILGEETNMYKVFDNEVAKYSMKDPKLDDISKKDNSKDDIEKKLHFKDKKDREIQVMDTDKFIKKIKGYIK